MSARTIPVLYVCAQHKYACAPYGWWSQCLLQPLVHRHPHLSGKCGRGRWQLLCRDGRGHVGHRLGDIRLSCLLWLSNSGSSSPSLAELGQREEGESDGRRSLKLVCGRVKCSDVWRLPEETLWCVSCHLGILNPGKFWGKESRPTQKKKLPKKHLIGLSISNKKHTTSSRGGGPL